MTLQITAVYAVMLALWMMGLSAYVSALRGKTGLSIGDGGDMAMLERIRRHGNFIEVVPMAILLMAIAEMQGAGPTWLHLAGVILVIARLVHPFGISATKANTAARIVGSGGTFLAMLICIAAILWAGSGG